MKKAVCFLLAALLLILCACMPQSEEPEEELYLWFVSYREEALPELSRWSYSGAWEVPDMMEALLAGPTLTSGLTSPIPAGTQLLDWSLNGTLLQVDLSRAYGSLVGAGLTLADYCITLTLTQLEGVESVRITVEGREVSHRGKQVFREDDVVLSGAEEEPVELIAALCFRQAGGNQLGVEQRMFRLTESQSATLAVLQALLAGPEEAGLQALLPAELEVYSARVESGICYADFSAVLLSDIPETEEEQLLLIRSIVESLCSLGSVQGVQILVDGEPLTYYGQIDVSQPLN